MIKTDKVIVKWNSKIKKHYVDKGYLFTKMGEEFEVETKDLTDGSNIRIEVTCDYCGKDYLVSWYHRVQSNKDLNKDCCTKCKIHKQKELNLIRYGVEFPLSLESVKAKRKATLNEKYGVDNVFQIEEVKEKIINTNLDKYGEKCCLQNDEIKKKAEETLLEKYGATNYSQSKEWVEKYSGENSPRWKGGVAYHRVERATFEYNQWRKSVFITDNYICQCCKEHSRNLEAHHINNWKDNVDLRYDVNNGITFCQSCHIKFHQKYGKKDNNLEQLKEFLINNG